MEQCFKADFEEVLIDWLTRERRSLTGCSDLELEVLASPHRNSPFLTVAEWLERSRDGLPWRVLKLLVVLEEDPSEAFWHEVLEREKERWHGELERRLQYSDQVQNLGLPLSVPADGHRQLVNIEKLGPLRRVDLLDDTTSETTLSFLYLIRPYIAWPRLRDVGYSTDELKRWWATYCQAHEVAEHLREPLFQHFCEEALVDGRSDVLLTSGWRQEVFR